MHRKPIHLFVVFTCLACQPLSPPARSASASPAGATQPIDYVPATRSGSECTVVRARTATSTATDMAGMQRAMIRVVSTPPFPRGRRVAERLTVILRVGEDGRVMRDSVFVSGSADASYLRELKAAMQTNRYWPAVLDGCAVTLRTVMYIGPFTTR